MVGEIAKSTGNKKPLSNLTAEAVQPKGAVLTSSIVKLQPLSNVNEKMTPLTTPYGESPLGSYHQGGTFESTVRYNDAKSNRQKKPLSN